jgi:hypothetical protein
LLGGRFDHRRCSKDCLEQKGESSPDCTNPLSVRKYMKPKRSFIPKHGKGHLDLAEDDQGKAAKK